MASFKPPVNKRNVLTGLASMYVQPVPVDPAAASAIPADTLALGAVWAHQNWIPLGASQEGLNFGFTRETNQIMIEEDPVPADERTETLNFTANVTLSEDTLQTMRIAYGGGTITSVAATTTTYGYEELKVSSEMEDFSFGFEGENKFHRPRRILIPVVKSVGEIETTYRRSEEQRLYAVSFKSLSAIEDCIFHSITAAPTGP